MHRMRVCMFHLRYVPTDPAAGKVPAANATFFAKLLEDLDRIYTNLQECVYVSP